MRDFTIIQCHMYYHLAIDSSCLYDILHCIIHPAVV